MNEDRQQPEESVPAPEDRSRAGGRGGRRRALWFVVSFVVMVMALLTGYRYAMNTEANMWYLYQVAKHTAWVLEFIGDSAGVEPTPLPNPASRRAQLAAWRHAPASVDDPVHVQPLTPYESWLYKAYSSIEKGESLEEDGPIVRFTSEEGLGVQMERTMAELNDVEQNIAEGQRSGSKKIEALRAEMAELHAKENAFEPGPERSKARRGVTFSFRVVPDCGAIPSMSIFIAAVLAFPTLLWKRLVGVSGGVAFLYGVNILRLATLGYIGAVDSSQNGRVFTFVHEYVWQGVFIIFVVAVWMLWVELIVRPRRA